MIKQLKSTSGFTLIELLVVISIIGVLSALLLSNFVGVRERAADARRKNDLEQLKKALRIYYNDRQHYPQGDGGAVEGCGSGGTQSCTGEFSNGSDTVYMKALPLEYSYYSDGEEDFLIQVELDNTSDEGITTSQARCSAEINGYLPAEPTETEYFVCAD